MNFDINPSIGDLFPKMTTTERDAIFPITNRMFIFNITTNQYEVFDGEQWISLIMPKNNIITNTGTNIWIAPNSYDGKHIRCTSTDPIIITIQDINYPVGFEVQIERAGTGTVTFFGAGSVVIRSKENLLSIDAQYCSVIAKHLGSKVWLLEGALA